MTKHKKKQQKILKLCVQKKYIFNNKTSGNETKPSMKKCEGGNQNIRNIHKTVTIVNKKKTVLNACKDLKLGRKRRRQSKTVTARSKWAEPRNFIFESSNNTDFVPAPSFKRC